MAINKKKREEKKDLMDKLAENILTLVGAVIDYAYLLPIIGGLVVGAAYAIPSEGTHNFAKKFGPGIIIGTIIAMGCIYLGKWFSGKISF